MEVFVTKQEEKLFRALEKLLTNCIDNIGMPKKPTSKQLYKASKALTDYENYAREKRAKNEQ